jgi:hypothetical protein
MCRPVLVDDVKSVVAQESLQVTAEWLGVGFTTAVERSERRSFATDGVLHLLGTLIRSDGKQTKQQTIVKTEAGGCGIYELVASALPAQPRKDDPGPGEKNQEQREGSRHEGGGRVSDRRVIQLSIAWASGWDATPLTVGSHPGIATTRLIATLSAWATLRVVSSGYGKERPAGTGAPDR